MPAHTALSCWHGTHPLRSKRLQAGLAAAAALAAISRPQGQHALVWAQAARQRGGRQAQAQVVSCC